jgi:RimJ/RimL family protein N-acetyltransferase
MFHAHEIDPEAGRRSQFTPRERDVFIAHWRAKVLGDPTVLVRTVTVDSEVAGHVVAWWEGERRYLGYWLGRDYWGRGVGTRALTQFLELEGARPLYADPYEGNTGSVRLLEKLGFARAGTERHGGNEHILFVLGADVRDKKREDC